MWGGERERAGADSVKRYDTGASAADGVPRKLSGLHGRRDFWSRQLGVPQIRGHLCGGNLSRAERLSEQGVQVGRQSVAASTGQFVMFNIKNEDRGELRDVVLLADLGMAVRIDEHTDKAIGQGNDGRIGQRLLAEGS